MHALAPLSAVGTPPAARCSSHGAREPPRLRASLPRCSCWEYNCYCGEAGVATALRAAGHDPVGGDGAVAMLRRGVTLPGLRSPCLVTTLARLCLASRCAAREPPLLRRACGGTARRWRSRGSLLGVPQSPQPVCEGCGKESVNCTATSVLRVLEFFLFFFFVITIVKSISMQDSQIDNLLQLLLACKLNLYLHLRPTKE